MSVWKENLQPKEKHYRALLRARYFDEQQEVRIVEDFAFAIAYNEVDAEAQFKLHPKKEPTQEDWHIIHVECTDK